jgi:hypothetical protein
MNEVLASPPKYFRAMSRGASTVDRTDGHFGAGVIHDVSVITQGEALGHELWIDSRMVQQVRDAINTNELGVKSRFTHPGMSGDGLGKHVGRIMDAELSADGRQVLADQHFAASAHRTPDGDLAGYLMDLADEDPEAYGLSIVFSLDEGEMQRYAAENANEHGDFKSPDPLNVNNFPHARLSELRAVDAVDEPAANPSGLFHREGIVEQADALASFALGISDDRPATMQLGLDPERVRGFVSRFLSTHNLELKTKMETEQVTDPVTEPESTEPTPTEREEAARFHTKFGERGAVWFAEGLTFDEARDKEVEELHAEVASLKQKLAALSAAGEDTPVSFDAGDQKTKGGFASKIRCK